MANDKLSSKRDDFMAANMPAGVIGACLLFWGLASANLTLAICLCLLAEATKLSSLRWNLTSKNFQQIADLTSVLFAVVAVYQFIQHAFHGIYGILGLLPLCLFPLIFSQRIATQQLFPMSALFLSLRRKIASGQAKDRWISTEFLFGISCILAAAVNEFEGYAYVSGAGLATVLLLIFTRATSIRWHQWVAPLGGVFALSWILLTGIEQFYRYTESAMDYWFRQFAWSYTSPVKTSTALGQLGRLKLSDKIVLRVKAPFSIPLPLYLHEASYTSFNLGSWHAKDADMVPIDRLPDQSYWALDSPPPSSSRELEITARQRRDLSVQAFPLGTYQVESDEIIELQTNALGSVSLEAIPGQLRYKVRYTNDGISLSADQYSAQDLHVPTDYHAVLDQIVDQLGLREVAAAEAVTLVTDYFYSNYRYSLVGKGDYPGKKPLVSFLTRDKAGHCEYFATATSLLLRRAGIPARYSVGYLVDEYSSLENAFIARARHAHAWVSAYVDGTWQTVDTTPGNWLALEQQGVSLWQSLNDLFSWFELHFKRLQRADRSEFNRRIIWLIPILAIVLLWRMRGRMTRVKSSSEMAISKAENNYSGELGVLFEKLSEYGYHFTPGSTAKEILRDHASRLANVPPSERLIELHYRNRYSPESLDSADKAELKHLIALYVAALERNLRQ